MNLTTGSSAPPSSPSPSSAATGFAPGNPAGGVLCQYDLGVPAEYSSGRLGRHVVLSAAALTTITNDLDALTPTNKLASCPPPEFVDVLTLTSADESTVSFRISCSMVWQGDVHAMLTDSLADAMQALLAAEPSAPASSAQPSTLTCGSIPVSDGKLRDALTMNVDGPKITPSAPAELTAGITLTGCARSPLDQTNADVIRQPLPPGAYTIYSVVKEYDGDSETDPANLVSAPFSIQVTDASPS